MNIFLIETETNHFANQIFSAWVKDAPGLESHKDRAG